MNKNELALFEAMTSQVQAVGSYIITKTTLPDAVLLLSNLNKTLDAVELEEDTITAPAQAIIKRERERWAPYKKPLKASIDALRLKLTQYQTLARKEEQEAKDAIAARVGEGKGHLKMDTAIAKIDAIDTPESKIATSQGSVSFRKVQKFEVTNLASVPVDYILPNETAIRNAMKLGKKIPGVRYFEEEVPYNTR